MPSAPVERSGWLRAAATLAVLAAVLNLFGRQYVEMCLPLYHATLRLARPGDIVGELAVDGRNGSVIRVKVERRMLVQGEAGMLRPALVVGRSSTQAGYALAHPFILFGVALVWPGLGPRRRIERILISLPLLALLEALDLPLAMAGGFEELLFAAQPASPGLDWSTLMDGGGRYALSFAMAGIAAAIHGAWIAQRGESMQTGQGPRIGKSA